MRHSPQRNVPELTSPPRKRQTPPTEQVDEAQGQIDLDQVDVERGIPAEHSESIERIEHSDRPDPPAFEE